MHYTNIMISDMVSLFPWTEETLTGHYSVGHYRVITVLFSFFLHGIELHRGL